MLMQKTKVLCYSTKKAETVKYDIRKECTINTQNIDKDISLI
jgi:hypothetical protein